MNTRLGVALTLLLHAPLSAQSARIDANPPTPPALRTAVQAALAADAFAVVPEVRPEGTPDRWTAANREQRCARPSRRRACASVRSTIRTRRRS